MRNATVLIRTLVLIPLLGACEPDASNPPENPGNVENQGPAVDADSSADAPIESGESGEWAATTEPEPEPEPPKRERIRIHNSCSKQVNLRIERMNDSDTNTMLTSNTGMEERASDGDEVRLLDDKYSVIHAITIEPHMKEIDIASNCSEVQGK